MAIEPISNPQFRADRSAEDGTPAVTADHSDEAMRRLRHPFEASPAGSDATVTPGERLAA